MFHFYVCHDWSDYIVNMPEDDVFLIVLLVSIIYHLLFTVFMNSFVFSFHFDALLFSHI